MQAHCSGDGLGLLSLWGSGVGSRKGRGVNRKEIWEADSINYTASVTGHQGWRFWTKVSRGKAFLYLFLRHGIRRWARGVSIWWGGLWCWKRREDVKLYPPPFYANNSEKDWLFETQEKEKPFIIITYW